MRSKWGQTRLIASQRVWCHFFESSDNMITTPGITPPPRIPRCHVRRFYDRLILLTMQTVAELSSFHLVPPEHSEIRVPNSNKPFNWNALLANNHDSTNSISLVSIFWGVQLESWLKLIPATALKKCFDILLPTSAMTSFFNLDLVYAGTMMHYQHCLVTTWMIFTYTRWVISYRLNQEN